MRLVLRTALAAVLLASYSSQAAAQMYEAVGTRAQGMAGAFVAVADDATANWWNPAGLATGAYFNAVLERGRTTQPAEPAGSDARASRVTTTGFSVAFPALGLSYYRLRISQIGPPTAIVADGRQTVGRQAVEAASLQYSQFGATVGQSLGQHFVLGSTLKLLRAGAATGVPLESSSLDAADDLPTDERSRVGLDLGAMASFRVMRVGVSVRNVHEVNIGSDEQPLRLKRQSRAGVAFLAGKHGILDAITAAADADLTRTPTVFGDVRHVATGAEAWLFGRHIGVRGGVSVNSIGDLRPVTSLGASIAPLSGFFVDGAWSDGRDGSLRGWTTSLRVTF